MGMAAGTVRKTKLWLLYPTVTWYEISKARAF